ncbi:methyl-accepting chemotaxis protein [Chrysiogenes arsenatis]|uniref:methyl-accepting chemotaxis protein n=1 Tax=Chrysiogenes arsenatis TaxID=309797 RepID=UPI000412826B|nr:nitrate- and nitrite sensing domain-containing protein [Chrysiogenes arsenatis]
MRWLSRLSIKIKLGIIVLIPLCALITVSGLLVHSSWKQTTMINDLHAKATISVYIGRFIHEMQLERGVSAGFLSSQGSQFRNEVNHERQQTDRALSALQSALTQERDAALNEALTLLGTLTATRSRIDALSIPTTEAISAYSAIIQKFLASVARITHQSEDGQISRNLIAYASIMQAKEAMGQERATLNGVFARNEFTPEAYQLFISLLAQQQTALDLFTSQANPSTLNRLETLQNSSELRTVLQMRETAFAKATTGNFGIQPQQWFRASTAFIDQMKILEDSVASELEALLQQQLTSAEAQLTLTLILSIAAVVIAAALALIIADAIGRSISRINSRAREFASGSGDLTQRLDDSGSDELARLSASFNSFITNIDCNIGQTMNLIAKTSGATAGVLEVMGRVRYTSLRNLDTTNELSAAAHEMSATINEISRSVTTSADSAETTVKLAREGATKLEASTRSAMQLQHEIETLAGEINELQTSARNIGSVVTVINDISDQTNLLALNAAIEAARAGEAGRGFAVVADEVRKLAENTQQSTKQIEKSIQTILEEIERATVSARQASGMIAEQAKTSQIAQSSFQEIMAAIEEMGEMILSISAALEEQSATTNQVAGNIEQLAGRSERLNEQVRILGDDTDVFVATVEELRNLYQPFNTNNRATPFIIAKVTHVLFLHKVLGAVLSEQRNLSLPDHQNCAFGKYCATSAMDAFRNDPLYQSLTEPHKRVHALGRALVESIGHADDKTLEERRLQFLEAIHAFLTIVDQLIEKYSTMSACQKGLAVIK